jgi:Ca2+/Na+ antiporter
MQRLLATITSGHGNGSLLKFCVGVGLLLTSSHFIVRLSSALADSTGLTTLFIGLFIVSIGTSLPELAFEIKAVLSGQVKMALGDLLGSVVANSTLILGLAAIIRPSRSQSATLTLRPRHWRFTVSYFAFITFVKPSRNYSGGGTPPPIELFLFALLEFARTKGVPGYLTISILAITLFPIAMVPIANQQRYCSQ